jgi:phenylpyruvate tautomerase PptA (4-oxalocrotonate tautomerase family)
MPMLDAFIAEGALMPEAEAKLVRELTDLLMRHEGVDPSNERARAASLVYLHRPTVYVGGVPATVRRYKFVVSVLEGSYDDERRSAVVRDVTEAVARAEGTSFADAAARTWVFPIEIPDGRWGARGGIVRLPDFLGLVLGGEAAADATRRFAERRRKEASAILAAARGTDAAA